MISVVLMDIGNVLIDFDIKKLLLDVVQQSGKSQQDVLLYLLKTGLADKFEKGLIGTQPLFEKVRSDLGYPGSFDAFRDSWNGIFSENAGGVAAFRALKKLKPVFLASNTNELHYAHIEQRYPFIREADGAVLSHKIHARKPKPEFFRKAVARIAAPAEEILLIDDTPENVQGARACGLAAVRYTDLGALRDALKEHQLEI